MRQSHKDLVWPARPNSSGVVIGCDEKLGPVGKDHANKEATHSLFTLVSCTSLFHVVSNTVTLIGVRVCVCVLCVCVCVCVCVFACESRMETAENWLATRIYLCPA